MLPSFYDDMDPSLKEELREEGKKRIEWAFSHMPVLSSVSEEVSSSGTLKGIRIGMALHVEAKTGVLAVQLARAGAEVRLASCNPLSTNDRDALALETMDTSPGSLKVRARYGMDRDNYYRALNWTLDHSPQIVIDDGGDLVKLLHTERKDLLGSVLGGCEETTTGIIRLRSMAAEKKLMFPMMDVNGGKMKHLFDNRYGTGQSTIDGLLTATNLSLAGKRCVVAGYGWCGKGIAMRLRGMGALVTISEVDPVKGVEAAMDGYRVLPMMDACGDAELVISATGCKGIVGPEIIGKLPDGCILANSGHFDNEIDVAYLEDICSSSKEAREHVTAYRLGERTIYLLGRGRLVNLVAGQGHPVEIMDLSFTLQMLGAVHIKEHGLELPRDVVVMPPEIDRMVALRKLSSMGYGTDELTEEQVLYLRSWEEGT